MPLITCKNLTLYSGGRDLLDGVDFSVSSGDTLAIIGENKPAIESLMRILLGIEPPREGMLILGDCLKRRDIGFLPGPDAPPSYHTTVERVVLSGCLGRHRFGSFYTKSDKAAAEANMVRLGIVGLAGRPFSELSGGQRQRVLLARAFCADHRLLILDQPTAGLDAAVSSELYRIIEDLRRERGTSIILRDSEKNAVALATHILRLDYDLIYTGTKDEYLSVVDALIFP